MSTKLNEQIAEAIRSNLPASVGEELRKRLEQADYFESQHKLRIEQVEKMQVRIEGLEERLSQHEDISFRERRLDAREKEVSQRELRIEIRDLEVKFANQRAADLKEVTLAVFANSQYKYFASHSETGNDYGPQGSTQVNRSRTVSIQEEK